MTHQTSSSEWLAHRLNYYRRLLPAYLLRVNSQLTFWHGAPEVNLEAPLDRLGQYYMTFAKKAKYPGPFDAEGIPLLDYRGKIGRQYNPIAISQYGLGNYNLFLRNGDPVSRKKFLLAADWLVSHLEPNSWDIPVWHHYFDFEYRDTLRSPWYSGLAQGQGLSLLVRAHQETGHLVYMNAAQLGFSSFLTPVESGGVTWEWPDGDIWFEEYMVDPPTHILNGFIWALWGVYDYSIGTGDQKATQLFHHGLDSLKHRLPHYDKSHWTLYEMSGTRLNMIASPFYHRLHIVQLQVMERLVGDGTFGDWASRWDGFAQNPWYRKRALLHKLLFKLLYY